VAFWIIAAVLMSPRGTASRGEMSLGGLLVGLSLVSVVALGQWITGVNLHPYWVNQNPDLVRTHATLDDPNALASFLVLGAGVAAGAVWALRDSGRALGGLAWTALVLSLMALPSTGSRTGLAALPIAGVLTLAMLPLRLFPDLPRARRWRRVAWILIGGLAVVAAVWIAALRTVPVETAVTPPDTLARAVAETVVPTQSLDQTLKGRTRIWAAAVEFSREEPILGIGVGQFPRRYGAVKGSHGPENAHNFFLQVLAESGVVGISGLIALLVAIGAALRALLSVSGIAEARLIAGVTWGVIAFALTWMTSHPLLTVSNQLWLAAVLAVTCVVAARYPWRSA
jgi:O-antigen ligase